MAISLVTGKIGSGKTIWAVEEIVEHLSKGLTVYTNIDLIFEEIKKYVQRVKRVTIVEDQFNWVDINNDRNWDEKIRWGTQDGNVLCVWDEVQLFFNSRDWAKTQESSKKLLSFLTQSRKACVDVVFITQVSTTMEKQFRVQAQWEYYIINSKQLSLGPLGRLPFNFMIVYQKDNESRLTVKTTMKGYSKRLFPLYNTLSMLDTEMQNRAKTVVRAPKQKLNKVSWWRCRL